MAAMAANIVSNVKCRNVARGGMPLPSNIIIQWRNMCASRQRLSNGVWRHRLEMYVNSLSAMVSPAGMA